MNKEVAEKMRFCNKGSIRPGNCNEDKGCKLTNEIVPSCCMLNTRTEVREPLFVDVNKYLEVSKGMFTYMRDFC